MGFSYFASDCSLEQGFPDGTINLKSATKTFDLLLTLQDGALSDFVSFWVNFIILFIRPTCWDVLWYGAGVCLSVCLSVGLSAKLVNMILTEPFQLGLSKLGTHTTYDKRTNPIDFQGHGSKVKVTCYTLLLNLVKHDTDWTVSLTTVKLGTHTTYDKRTISIDFQIRGQRSRSHATHCCKNLH